MVVNWILISWMLVNMDDFIEVFIDFFILYLWLLIEVCDCFVDVFNLIWREDFGLYIFVGGGE